MVHFLVKRKQCRGMKHGIGVSCVDLGHPMWIRGIWHGSEVPGMCLDHTARSLMYRVALHCLRDNLLEVEPDVTPGHHSAPVLLGSWGLLPWHLRLLLSW